MKTIAKFFHEISPRILKLARESRTKTGIVNQKVNTEHSVDFATETDVAMEKLITQAIREKFPGDAILAEEESSQTALDSVGRLWIIDPICGTSNFSRGLPLFVSNIALAEKGKIIASCVVDHMFGKYFWSVGNGVYENDKHANTKKKTRGTIIDIDVGALISAPQGIKNRYAEFTKHIIRETDISLVTLNSSSSFLYVALGIYDAFVSPYIHAWDISASSFLIEQTGGIITDFEGKPRTLASHNGVATRDPKLHSTLLKLLS